MRSAKTTGRSWQRLRTIVDVYKIAKLYTRGQLMRTNINIDEDLMDEAMKASGLTTKRETVEAGLRLLVQLKRQQRIRSYRGKLRWEGDLERMRRDA